MNRLLGPNAENFRSLENFSENFRVFFRRRWGDAGDDPPRPLVPIFVPSAAVTATVAVL